MSNPVVLALKFTGSHCPKHSLLKYLLKPYVLPVRVKTVAKKKKKKEKDHGNKIQRKTANQSAKPPPSASTISTSCSPIKLNLVTCSRAPQKLEEINSNANEKVHNLLSAEECMLH